MTKRRKQRTKALLAVARRGLEAAAAASIPNAAAIVLATAGAPAPGASLAAFAAIGRFDRTPITQVRWNRPLRLLPLLRTLQPQQSFTLPAGRKRRASSSPDVRLKLLARKGYCARHACADAQGCDSGSDCTALPCAAVRWKALQCAAL